MRDALKGYTLRGSSDGEVVLDCDRCRVEAVRGTRAPLVAFVRAAIAHAEVCLG